MHLKTYPAVEQGPLGPGERLYDLRFLRPDGETASLYDSAVFGWPVAMHVAPTAESAAAGCAALAAQAADFAALGARIAAVTGAAPPDNAALARRLALSFPVLTDADGALAHALTRAMGEAAVRAPCTLILDPILRLEAVFGESEIGHQTAEALTWLQARAAAQPAHVVTAQAPALVLPHVLEPEQCRRLIHLWESGQKIQGQVASDGSGGNTVNRKSKVRTDVAVPENSNECRDLLGAISRRLLPEVLKGFGYRVSRVETPRIGCYDAGEGGHFAPHRDNTNKQTEYRRFAMSLNLNTGEYEGGYLRFPEFGPQLYLPGVGGAVVFCCSVLHQAMPVTEGRRFGLFAFFYGEEEEALRQRNNATMSAAAR